MGLSLSIDDFGTGHSSLSYLEAFPFSEFKIDRTFVSGLDQNRAKHIIVEAMIRLGRELEMSVTAEGAETEEELSVLRELNCPCVQGYIFGRPMTESDFANLVARAPSGAGAEDPLVGGDPESRNAILIDDDSLVREVLGGALEVLGWDVTPIASAEAALAMSDIFPTPRLIVTDVNLGAGMSGFELLPHARRRWPDAGIIVISGRPVEPNALAALGDHEIFLAKPASIATLDSAISRVVVNASHVGPRTAERSVNAEYAKGPASGSHRDWGDLAVGSAAALAPAASSHAGVDTLNAPHTAYDVQTPATVPVTVSSLNVAAEVRDLMSQMARPVPPRTVRVLVAIEPDLTILANQAAFRGLLSRVIADAIADTGASGGRVLLTAVPEGRKIRLTVIDEAEAADQVQREAALRYSDEWAGIPDGSLDVRLVPGSGIEVILTLTAA
jgi:CheY-like chemotaxis protein